MTYLRVGKVWTQAQKARSAGGYWEKAEQETFGLISYL